ncbi:MAG TPA: T9SS type A sorting domain-containing protein [Ignavibacteria bacterium]|nr:T9SS type A sorting domain-containing protein [Ignavibacteria bacterium]HQY53055.1 T9SS type A sorting domain-containing protein [Ignavibacteria bacterium]HRB01164.1 T9SS type A sorting domain-containing protein [Ignavibacteria bacterium]
MKNFKQFFTSLFILALALSINSDVYSQWTLAGLVTNAGTSPSISVVDQNIVWVAGGPTGTPVVSRSTNAGANWTNVPTSQLPLEVYCVWGIDANTCYVGNGGAAGGAGGNAQYYKTTDAGVTWTVVGSTGGSAGFFNGVVFSKTMPSFGVAQSDPPTGAGQSYYLGITTDGGLTWTPTTATGFAGTASAQNSIVVIDNMFYGFGSNTTPPAFIYTSNGGTSWQKSNTGAPGNFTSGVAFSDDKMHGLVSSSTSLPTIARTTNGGVSFTNVTGVAGLTGYSTIKWIEGTNTVYTSSAIGASGVVQKSTNGGLNWTVMSTSSLTGITHMEFRRVGNTVYGFAVTANGAVLKLVETITGVNNISSSVPDGYSLDQNFPNPFNPSTTINFSIPVTGKVNLTVYNSLGKEVATLVNENLAAGSYSSEFTAASDLTSGIYFYTITSGNFSDTKKLMLVK